jgi:hypothetical protein
VDLRFTVGSAKRYPIDWVFCSMRCQACFHRLYVSGLKMLKPDGHGSVVMAQGAVMIDPSEAEIIAMRRCLKPLGDAASAIGINRPLASYSQDEALRLINAVVTTYVETMVQEHERSKYPPVRMQLSPPDGRNS